MEELKPCPFCGGEASMRTYLSGRYAVECDECRVSSPVMGADVEAVAVWNRREAKA